MLPLNRRSSTASRSSPATPASGTRISDIVIHGTTLATNALIARRGARTALVTTEGFRDVIEMRTENRFEQYDLNLRLPSPLIPREHRFTREGADRRRRAGASAARRGRARTDRRHHPRRRLRRRRDRLHPLLRQSGARAPGARNLVAAGCRSPISISRPRFRRRCASSSASTPSAPTPMSARRWRTISPGCKRRLPRHGRQLPGVHDPFGRRADLGRNRVGVSGAPGRIRPRGRRDLRGRHRPPFRSRQGGLLRHGRHHGEDLPDRGLRAAAPRAPSRSRAPTASARAPACRSRSRSSR